MKKELLTEIQSLLTLLEVRTTFKWNEFKKLTDPKQILQYALDHLDPLGKGTSRMAFQTGNSGQVLKVALNNKGLGQNKTEVEVYTNPATKNVVCRIFAAAPDYSWLVAEPAREFKVGFNGMTEFSNITGIRWASFEKIVSEIGHYGNSDDLVYFQGNKFLNGVLAIMKNSGVASGDLVRLDHYGKAADGRVVLLDYGLTPEVWKQYYGAKKQMKNDQVVDVPGRESTQHYMSPQDIMMARQRKSSKSNQSNQSNQTRSVTPTPVSPQNADLPNTAPSRPKRRAQPQVGA